MTENADRAIRGTVDREHEHRTAEAMSKTQFIIGTPTNSRADSFASVIVYPLWHVGHQNEAGDDGSTVHVDESGVFCDEADGDDVKLLGIYSTLERVEGRMRQARRLPGFRDESECFYFDACELDEDNWTEGFVRVPPGE
ncbi:hypothetical protein [Streptomyces sp. NPDC058307]|uniref:hypothetical protein n=1 Tax=Streptomyces sp. NPDC058307 TaxID=3346439 RepID=UPI0036E2C552